MKQLRQMGWRKLPGNLRNKSAFAEITDQKILHYLQSSFAENIKTHKWSMLLSYRNWTIDLLSKSINWLLYGWVIVHEWNKQKRTGLIDSMIGCPLLWFTWNCNWLNSPATRSKNFPGSFLEKELHAFLILGLS